MNTPVAVYVPLRPITAQVKWWIVAVAALLLGAWEMLFHVQFMELPMIIGHRLNAGVAAVLVGAVVLAFFVLLQQYEQQLAAAAEALRQKNEALRALEAGRDSRLLDLTRDLALALVDITNHCEIALSLPETGDARKTLADVNARARRLHTVARALLELEREGAEQSHPLPALLEGCERAREIQPVV
jgi:hypothetical protein